LRTNHSPIAVASHRAACHYLGVTARRISAVRNFRGTRKGRRSAVASFVAALAFGAFEQQTPAATQTSVALEYEIALGTIGCPDSIEFGAAVTRQLGYDPFQTSANRRVSVQLARRENGFDGRIRWSDAGGQWVGERKLSSRRSDCSDIAASVAFSVAVQIQLLAALAPNAPAAPPPEPPPPPPPPPIEPPPMVVAPPPPEPAPPASERHLRWSLGLGPSLAFAIAPRPMAIGRLFVGAALGPLSFELAADAALPSRTDSGASGFTLRRFAASAAGCGHLSVISACLTGTFGLLQVHGFGVDQPAAPIGRFAQLGARIVARQDLGDRFFAAVRVEGLAMLSIWQVKVNDTVTWTTPRAGGLVGLDFGVRFF
jgi:hypothetical protein